MAVLHSQALLGGRPGVIAVGGDMRDPEAILGRDELRAAGLDPGAPACVVLACVLHFVDAPAARGIVSALLGALAPGSYLVISVGFGRGRAGTDFASMYNAQDGQRIYAHSWEEITGMFAGLELVPPGVVDATAWHPGQPDAGLGEPSNMIVAGVGRRA